jgi:hypothetical protein
MYPDDQEVASNMSVYLEHLLGGQEQQQTAAGVGEAEGTQQQLQVTAAAAAAATETAAEGRVDLPTAVSRQTFQAAGGSRSSSGRRNIPESLIVQAGRMFRKVVPGGQVGGFR